MESSFFGSESLGQLVEDSEDNDEEDLSDKESDNKIDIIDHAIHNEEDLSSGASSPGKNDVKLPEIGFSNKEVKKSPKKFKVAGDIHFRPQHLKHVGYDLCRTMYLFFNETIKLRKLQSLRNIKMRSRTIQKSKFDKKSDKQINSDLSSPLKINLTRKVIKGSLSPNKNRTEKSKYKDGI
jgi:hypothetical protein